jgi:capsule polysaccharide modification protein KpsS
MRTENPSLRRADQGLLEVNSGDAWGHARADTSPRGNLPPPSRKANGRRILIIQSDWESGMSRLALDLKDAGHKVSKVFFCAPDLIYAYRGIRIHLFRKPIAEFESWLRQLIQKHGYDTFFLYNHYRPYNQIAWDLAHELKLDCQVFELGLIRPDCVMVFDKNTLPIDEVPRLWEKVLRGEYKPQPVPRPAELCQVNTTAKLIQFCTNFLFSRITYPLFPHFVDQRQMNLWHHLKHSMIHLVRFIERDRDCELDPWFAGELSDRYYAVPLQVHSDTQIIKCSDFTSIEQFIRKVAISFANHAPPDTKLVFKVHPMDRGYKDYSDLITGLNHRIGGHRLLYVDRVHLPTLLENARGVVNINSSVGISGLVHNSPVIALGDAVYDLPELTFQGDLDDFWTQTESPDPQRVKQFLNLLLENNQGRGTLSQRCFDVPNRCRIKWPAPFERNFFGEASATVEE